MKPQTRTPKHCESRLAEYCCIGAKDCDAEELETCPLHEQWLRNHGKIEYQTNTEPWHIGAVDEGIVGRVRREV